jgi:hypothetical protein
LIFKKKEILSWVNMEDITLSEIHQAQNNKYCRTALICGILKSQPHRNREQKDGNQSIGVRHWEDIGQRTEIFS